MRVIAVLGRVLDPGGIVFNRRRGRMFVNREEYLLQPADRCALEAALRIKDLVRPQRSPSVEVVAFPRAPLPDDDVLRQALSAGADRAVYLTGDGFREAISPAPGRSRWPTGTCGRSSRKAPTT
jgi:electron transfer flavoprotein alpha/beta subunit